MTTNGELLVASYPSMNPNAYGPPSQALFAANMGPASFMLADPYGAGPSVTDAYMTPALFGPMPPGPAAAYMYSSSSSSNVANPSDEIRTVFVSGFPHDVKERELHNLLRFMPGYEASQMNWKTGGPQGFALFSSAAHARAVVEVLSGLQFDDGVVVRAEMAHKNMFIKVGCGMGWALMWCHARCRLQDGVDRSSQLSVRLPGHCTQHACLQDSLLAHARQPGACRR